MELVGLLIVAAGMLFERRQLIRTQQGVVSWVPVVDLNRPGHRKILGSLALSGGHRRSTTHGAPLL